MTGRKVLSLPNTSLSKAVMDPRTAGLALALRHHALDASQSTQEQSANVTGARVAGTGSAAQRPLQRALLRALAKAELERRRGIAAAEPSSEKDTHPPGVSQSAERVAELGPTKNLPVEESESSIPEERE